MDKFVKIAVIVASLLVGGGVFYHYVIFLPGIERAKQEQIALEKREAITKAETEKRDLVMKENTKKIAYEACNMNARTNYNANWAMSCKSTAQAQEARLLACLADPTVITNPYMGAGYCRRTYAARDASPECSLPATLSTFIDASYKEAKEKCLNEARTGL